MANIQNTTQEDNLYGELLPESNLTQPVTQYAAMTIHDCFAVSDTSTQRQQVSSTSARDPLAGTSSSYCGHAELRPMRPRHG